MCIASDKIQESDYMEQYEKVRGNYKDGYSACPICGRLINWELDDFIEWCQFGMLKDEDGYGYYSNSSDGHEPLKDFIVRPSDVVKDNVKYDYKYVHWYKKEQA